MRTIRFLCICLPILAVIAVIVIGCGKQASDRHAAKEEFAIMSFEDATARASSPSWKLVSVRDRDHHNYAHFRSSGTYGDHGVQDCWVPRKDVPVGDPEFKPGLSVRFIIRGDAIRTAERYVSGETESVGLMDMCQIAKAD